MEPEADLTDALFVEACMDLDCARRKLDVSNPRDQAIATHIDQAIKLLQADRAALLWEIGRDAR